MMTMRLPWQFAPGAAYRMRLSAALALSALLHAAVLYNVHGAGRGGAPSAGNNTLSVRLQSAEQQHPGSVSLPRTAPNESLSEPAAPVPQTAAAPQPASAIAPATPGPNGPARFSDARYYLGSELDRRATPLHAIEPVYPDESSARGHNVVLRIFISERGTVDDVAVQSAGQAAEFENSAREAFARARFAPGTLRGVPVKSELMVEVKFDPGTASARSGDVATAAPQLAN